MKTLLLISVLGLLAGAPREEDGPGHRYGLEQAPPRTDGALRIAAYNVKTRKATPLGWEGAAAWAGDVLWKSPPGTAKPHLLQDLAIYYGKAILTRQDNTLIVRTQRRVLGAQTMTKTESGVKCQHQHLVRMIVVD